MLRRTLDESAMILERWAIPEISRNIETEKSRKTFVEFLKNEELSRKKTERETSSVENLMAWIALDHF